MITLVDTSLRDGMSSVAHAFTPEQVGAVAGGLDGAGVRVIEVAHGIGIGASSVQYGFAAATDVEYVRAAVAAVDRADIAVLYVPGSRRSRPWTPSATRGRPRCGSPRTAPRPTAPSSRPATPATTACAS
ncbi:MULTISPECIES: hypothetical protein [unclassified Actinomadura]|uniref:hypothetical protein n=1 Tax=unclassified Actinomadura TaxID=2626254 RepID=UPI0022865A65|nr:hypothetical protein [Actinomadura sp. K4S16]